MAITNKIYYRGEGNNARLFAEEMISCGNVERIKKEKGLLKYEYFFPEDDENTVILINSWKDKESLDFHHSTITMQRIIKLIDKYELAIRTEQFITEGDTIPENDLVSTL